MKYIFDFDDVLFNNTAQFKKHMFRVIAKAGVSEDTARKYYLEVHEKEFSLKKFMSVLFSRYNINENKVANSYKKIMEESPDFLNIELIEKVKKLEKENCFIVTNGEREFNQDKIKYSGIGNLFKKIYIVPGTKKEVICALCRKYKNEKVFFVDDKIKFFADLDFKKCPNLTTILYNNQTIL